jgi:ankyrin repeat protein
VKRILLPLLLLVALYANAAGVRLVDAVKNRDKAAIRTLIQQRVDVNAPEPDGATALHWAVRTDDLETTDMLVRAGAKVDVRNRYGVTPLQLASANGNGAMVEMLLKNGADANTTLFEGETVLMVAARAGNAAAVKALLDHGANVNAKESWRGQTALMWAAAEGNSDVIRLLVARGADMKIRSNGGFTAFLFAVREGRIGGVKTFLELGADLNESLLVRRRAGGGAPAGAAPPEPEPGANAFMLAAENAHYELAAVLLDAGANPNSAPQGWTALHQVTWTRKAGFGDNNPAPPGSGNMGSLDFVKALAKHGANLNARVTKRPSMGTTSLNSIGATPFLLAARTADADLMRLLIELGADPRLTNDDGATPLMVAAGVGTNSPGEDPGSEPEVFEAVKIALQYGGDINAIDKNGETAMHGAAYKHVPLVARYLAEHGAKVEIWNQPNKRGWTPLRITQGIPVGMNIAGDAPTRAVIQELLDAAKASGAAR